MRVQLLGSFNKECAYEKAMQNPGEYIRLFTRDESDIYDPNVEGIELGAEYIIAHTFLTDN